MPSYNCVTLLRTELVSNTVHRTSVPNTTLKARLQASWPSTYNACPTLQLHRKKLSANSDYSPLTKILGMNVYTDLEIFDLNDRSKSKYANTAIQSNNGCPMKTRTE